MITINDWLWLKKRKKLKPLIFLLMFYLSLCFITHTPGGRIFPCQAALILNSLKKICYFFSNNVWNMKKNNFEPWLTDVARLRWFFFIGKVVQCLQIVTPLWTNSIKMHSYVKSWSLVHQSVFISYSFLQRVLVISSNLLQTKSISKSPKFLIASRSWTKYLSFKYLKYKILFKTIK